MAGPDLRSRSLGSLALLAVTAAVFLFFFADRIACLFPKAGTPYKSAISGCDNSYYYFWLRAPMVRHDVDFARDVSECATMPDDLRQLILASDRTPLGLVPNKYGIGWAVGEVPWYLLGAGATRLLGLPHDGYGSAYQTALFLGQLVYAILSLILAWRIALRFVSRAHALPGVLLMWLGSFLVYYQASATTMAHNFVFFALTLATWAALKLEETPRPSRWLWAALGAGMGLAVISRYQAIVLLLHPALVALRLAWKKPALRSGLALALLLAAACLALQMAAWKAVFGSWLMPSYGTETFHWLHPHLWDVLFSPFHGLFYWNPALLLGTVGALLLAWRKPKLAPVCWLLSFLAMWLVNGAWECWFFGASFGLRAFEGAMLPIMVGFGFLLDRLATSRWKTVLIAAAVLLAFANVSLVYLARKDRISSEEPVTHAEMGRQLTKFWQNGRTAASTPR